MTNGGKRRQVFEKFGGASRDRTDDLIVANDGVLQKISIWRALGSRLRSKTVQFRQARRGVASQFYPRAVGAALASVMHVTTPHRPNL